MDELRHKDRIPPSAVDQLQRLCDLLRQSLPTLAGVILHGSAASAGFEPDRSDLDVLAIVNADPDRFELARVGKGILMISGDPHPLEFSIVSRHALMNWQHPCPHLFHFGEGHQERFESARFLPESPTDDDLAMHLVVARARGIDLTGTFSVSELPEIPRSDFLAAVLSDFEWAQDRDEDLSDYVLSNACRTLAYLEDEVILSKSEGRQWCADRGIDASTVVENVTRELKRI
jgi:streptomycin 3"-adenylyltransferase